MAQKTILIVEDEEIIRRLCKRLLADSGHRLLVVGCVREALETLEVEVPDLLVTDLRLPDGDGVHVIQALRQKKNQSRVIIITGSPTPEDRLSRAAELGATEFVYKPFEGNDFKAAVSKALES
jgi:DNA-binding NtrC family response regulator